MGARPGPAEGVPGALAPAEGRVRGPDQEPGQGPGLRRRGPVADRSWSSAADKRERVNNDSEQDLTNAFIKVTRDRQEDGLLRGGRGRARHRRRARPRASPAQGRPRPEPVRDARRCSCCASQRCPRTARCSWWPGPQKDLLPQAVDAIRGYVKGGGKALVLAEPELKENDPNLDALLKEWNIEAGHDVVVDVSRHGPDLRHRRAHAASPRVPVPRDHARTSA